MSRSSLSVVLLLAACGSATGETTGDATSTSSENSTGLQPAASESAAPDPGTVTSDSSSSGDASAGGFLGDVGPLCGPPPDGTSFHCWECDIWDQDCAAGDKCNPWANDGGDRWNATICTPIDPDGGGPGERCTVERTPATGRDSCRIGSMCWNADPATLEGECVELCQGSENDPVCPATDTDCLIANEGVLILCLQTCDPLDVDACEDGQSCRRVDEKWFCLPDGAPVMDGPLEPTLCPPGTTAVDPEAISTCDPDNDLCCAEICDVASPACADPLQCTPVAKEGNVGLCLDPV